MNDVIDPFVDRLNNLKLYDCQENDMTVNTNLRLPPDLAALLDQVARKNRQSRHSLILTILETAMDGPHVGLCAGYVALTGGELDGAECPECGGEMVAPRMGFTIGVTRPLAFGPVCARCATTE
jgi:hypothetical protein